MDLPPSLVLNRPREVGLLFGAWSRPLDANERMQLARMSPAEVLALPTAVVPLLALRGAPGRRDTAALRKLRVKVTFAEPPPQWPGELVPLEVLEVAPLRIARVLSVERDDSDPEGPDVAIRWAYLDANRNPVVVTTLRGYDSYGGAPEYLAALMTRDVHLALLVPPAWTPVLVTEGEVPFCRKGFFEKRELGDYVRRRLNPLVISLWSHGRGPSISADLTVDADDFPEGVVAHPEAEPWLKRYMAPPPFTAAPTGFRTWRSEQLERVLRDPGLERPFLFTALDIELAIRVSWFARSVRLAAGLPLEDVIAARPLER